jgi:hypothetical protein
MHWAVDVCFATQNVSDSTAIQYNNVSTPLSMTAGHVSYYARYIRVKQVLKTQTTSPTFTLPGASASNTSSNTSSPTVSGTKTLPTAIQAGIGVSVTLGALGAIAGIYVLQKRHKRRQSLRMQSSQQWVETGLDENAARRYRRTAEIDGNSISELPSISRPVELESMEEKRGMAIRPVV